MSFEPAKWKGQLTLPAVLLTMLTLVACGEADRPPAGGAGAGDTTDSALAVESTAMVRIDDAVLADRSLTSSWPAYGGTHFETRGLS